MRAPARYERYAPGEEVADPQTGDVLLIRGRSWPSVIIRWAERRRPRADRRYGHWSHCALVAGPSGLLFEVTSAGVVVRHVSAHRDEEYHYVRLDRPPEERLRAALYAKDFVGRRYTVLSFLRLGWNLVIRWPRLSVPDRGQQVCASLVGRALERAGERFALPPHELMAADLAKHFGVVP